MVVVPVLVTAFNKPKLLEELLLQLSKYNCKIYVALDNARSEDVKNLEYVKECKEVILRNQEILTGIRISENAQGCFKGVVNAITWAFQSEKFLIILEEDVMVERGFLEFASKCLLEFEEDLNIGSIAAMNFVPSKNLSEAKNIARLSKFTSSWGWATWKTRWLDFLSDLDDFHLWNVMDLEPISKFNQRVYWGHIMNELKAEKIDSWAYRWLFSNWKRHRLTIIPNVNLALNRGFVPSATHTKDLSIPWWLPTTIQKFDSSYLQFPTVVYDKSADSWMEKYHFRTNLFQSFKNRIRKHFPFIIKYIYLFKISQNRNPD